MNISATRAHTQTHAHVHAHAYTPTCTRTGTHAPLGRMSWCRDAGCPSVRRSPLFAPDPSVSLPPSPTRPVPQVTATNLVRFLVYPPLHRGLETLNSLSTLINGFQIKAQISGSS